MAGKRMLHSNICESRKMSRISYQAEALYYRLLTRVDDNGNYFADARIIQGACFPLRKDATLKKVEKWIEELIEKSGKEPALLSMYEEDGEKYIHFNRFEDFQYLRSDIRRDEKYPLHPKELDGEEPLQRSEQDTDSKLETAPERHGKVTVTYTHPAREGIRDVGISKVKSSKVKEREVKSSNPHNEGFDFGRLKRRYQNIVGKMPSGTNTNVELYGKFCLQYGEANILKWFEIWAPDRKDYLKSSKNGIGLFWKDVPDFAKAAEEAGVMASGEEEENSPEDDRPPTYDPIKAPLRSTKVPVQ